MLGSFEASWFYSDSLNDLPLLSRVTHPVAVDPDATLRAKAMERGWEVISLKENQEAVADPAVGPLPRPSPRRSPTCPGDPRGEGELK